MAFFFLKSSTYAIFFWRNSTLTTLTNPAPPLGASPRRLLRPSASARASRSHPASPSISPLKGQSNSASHCHPASRRRLRRLLAGACCPRSPWGRYAPPLRLYARNGSPSRGPISERTPRWDLNGWTMRLKGNVQIIGSTAGGMISTVLLRQFCKTTSTAIIGSIEAQRK